MASNNQNIQNSKCFKYFNFPDIKKTQIQKDHQQHFHQISQTIFTNIIGDERDNTFYETLIFSLTFRFVSQFQIKSLEILKSKINEIINIIIQNDQDTKIFERIESKNLKQMTNILDDLINNLNKISKKINYTEFEDLVSFKKNEIMNQICQLFENLFFNRDQNQLTFKQSMQSLYIYNFFYKNKYLNVLQECQHLKEECQDLKELIKNNLKYFISYYKQEENSKYNYYYERNQKDSKLFLYEVEVALISFFKFFDNDNQFILDNQIILYAFYQEQNDPIQLYPEAQFSYIKQIIMLITNDQGKTFSMILPTNKPQLINIFIKNMQIQSYQQKIDQQIESIIQDEKRLILIQQEKIQQNESNKKQKELQKIQLVDDEMYIYQEKNQQNKSNKSAYPCEYRPPSTKKYTTTMEQLAISTIKEQTSAYDIKIDNKQLDKIEEEEKKEQEIQIVQEEELIKQIQLEECPICLEEEQLYRAKQCNFDHFFCFKCMLNHVNVIFDNSQEYLLESFDDIKCPGTDKNAQCKASLGTELLQKLWGTSGKFLFLQERIVQQYIGIQCPFNGCGEILDAQLQCQKNRHKICKKCKELQHEDPVCQKILNKVIEVFQQDGQRVRFCPVCFVFFIKDDHCEHVTCANCSTDFCFTCSALRYPTLQHDASYHREDCKYYDAYNQPDYRPQKCNFCRELGKQCEKPESYKDFMTKKIKLSEEQLELACFKN